MDSRSAAGTHERVSRRQVERQSHNQSSNCPLLSNSWLMIVVDLYIRPGMLSYYGLLLGPPLAVGVPQKTEAGPSPRCSTSGPTSRSSSLRQTSINTLNSKPYTTLNPKPRADHFLNPPSIEPQKPQFLQDSNFRKFFRHEQLKAYLGG